MTTPYELSDLDQIEAESIHIFREVVADPWPQVARVYADLGAELTGEAESSMRAWLDRQDKAS